MHMLSQKNANDIAFFLRKMIHQLEKYEMPKSEKWNLDVSKKRMNEYVPSSFIMTLIN
jgi:hypothetical protein